VVAERSHSAEKRWVPKRSIGRIFWREAIHLLRRIQNRATFPSFKKPNEGPSQSKAEMAAQ
jgi:hypothetical protein